MRFVRGTQLRAVRLRPNVRLAQLDDAALRAGFAETNLVHPFSAERFFDPVIVFLLSMTGLGTALEAQRWDRARAYTPENDVLIERGHQVPYGFRMFPRSLLQSLIDHHWPPRVDLWEFPADMPGGGARTDATALAVFRNAALMFMSYYERTVDEVYARYGSGTETWPALWNFARTVRNACAHDGRVAINNAAAPAVNWRGLTYTPADNGRDVFADLAPTDLIVLMEELECLL